MSGKRYVFKDGVWVPGKAAPRELPKHLRSLPGAIVTTDIEDPDKAHEYDPDYIVNDIAQKYQLKLIGKDPDKPQTAESVQRRERLNKMLEPVLPGHDAPLTQPRIDAVRISVIAELIQHAYVCMQAGKPFMDVLRVCHVWFPTNNVNNRELRLGNPPPDSARPKHLRGFDLVVDPTDWPQSLKAILKEYGINVPTIEELKLLEADLESSRAAKLNQ